MVPHTFRLLTEPEQQTPENLRRANILGWCVELVRHKFLFGLNGQSRDVITKPNNGGP